MLDRLLSTFQNIHLILPAILIAIVFHELAHGFTACLLGDPTAKNEGRLTLNPIKHIDPVGFLVFIFVGFGWAKPVPVNTSYFKNRKLGTILVSIAGPLTNFILAIIAAFILSLGIIRSRLILEIVLNTILYNIVLGVFNLLPFPPLDGSKVLASLLPTKFEVMFYKHERYVYILLLILFITDGINVILSPALEFAQNIILNMFF